MRLMEVVQQLAEVKMSPNRLKQLTAGINAVVGMEFEMIVPENLGTSEIDDDYVENWDDDESVGRLRDIRTFFYDGNYNTLSNIERLMSDISNDWGEWLPDQARRYFDQNQEQIILDHLDNESDMEDVEARAELERILQDAGRVDQIFQAWASETDHDDYDGDIDTYVSERFDTMQDVHQVYDITWPHWQSTAREATVDLSEIADDFSRAVGRKSEYSHNYHGAPRRPGMYAIEPDGSLDPDDRDSETGLEFVSPPLPLADMLSDLHKVKAWADEYGCYTNESCGLHMNVSLPDMDFDQLDVIKLVLFMGDDYVLARFGRVANDYAKSLTDIINSSARRLGDTGMLMPAMDRLRDMLLSAASKLLYTRRGDKYVSANVKEGYIEFRSPGGDWLNENHAILEQTLHRFVFAMSIAMDPTAFQREYTTKLYKLISTSAPSKDVLWPFAMYSCGLIDKSGLKAELTKVRALR